VVLHSAAATFRGILSGDLSYFGGPVTSPAVAARLRAAQIGAILHYLPWMMLANASNALVLVAALWSSPDRLSAIGWASVVIAYSGVYGIRSLRRRPEVETVSERTMRRAVRNAFMLGCMWAMLPLLFFQNASSGGQLIITCLSAGMLGGGSFAFATLPAAALAFATPLFAASAIAIARSGDQTYLLVAIMMIVYAVIILRGVVTYALQMTKHLARQIKVEEEARRDPLTSLANRIAFQENLSAAFARLERRREPFALLYLDLNDFKSVNDNLGHAAGDALLMQVADRLRAAQREGDIVARLGGDEFAVIAANVGLPEHALMLAERIVQTFDAPFKIDGHEISRAVSLGIALAPANGADVTSLQKNADIALYHAKRGAGGSVQLFEPGHDALARERRAIEHDLRTAQARGELQLVFQPILNLASEQVVACEALLRWHHPTRDVLLPGQFIPIAEETGLIHSIGEWVISEACRVAAGWPKDVRIAVNLSPVQLQRASILPAIVNALAGAGIAPSRLEIEITESSLVAKNDVAMVAAIRELGVTVALDDFGVGHSSLTQLRKLPLDRLKIDQSFVADLSTDPDCAAIVRCLIGLASDLGMSVTAEGVETLEQLSCLRSFGCVAAQGHLISVPRPAEDVAKLFGKAWKSSTHAA
jgi:diguanylate cyclase (GGDEF)-like protein